MNRRWHRQMALWFLLPFAIIFASGFLLQFKSWFPALQPPNRTSTALAEGNATIPLPRLLEIARTKPEAGVREWSDVRAIDIRPAQGVARLRTKRYYELQIDLVSGEILQAGPRYATWLIEVHEGAWFGKLIHQFVFLPTALAALILWASGAWLLWRYYRAHWMPRPPFLKRV